MADPEKVPESQDFRLVDEDAEKLDETQLTQMNEVAPETTVQSSVDVEKSNELKPEPEVATLVSEESEMPQEKDICSEVDEKKETAQVDNDDDDFVPSSQVESLSPLKKQISNLLGVTSQKRKAETPEEPVAKFPRTCSQENALSSVRKNLEDEADLFDTADDSMEENLASDGIIAETQESSVYDEQPKSLQEVEQELEEALLQSDVNMENAKPSDTENTENPSDENAAEKKSSLADVLEEKITSSLTEAIEEKESSIAETVEETKAAEIDDKTSSTTELIEEKKSSNGNSTEEQKPENGDTIETERTKDEDTIEAKKPEDGDTIEAKKPEDGGTIEAKKPENRDTIEAKKSENGDATEEKESANGDASEKITSTVVEEKKSPESEVAKVEESNSAETEKLTVPDSSVKEPEKVDSAPDTTAEDGDLEVTKSSASADTKDKAVSIVEVNPALKSDDSGVSSQTPEMSIKTPSEVSTPIQVSSNKSRMSIEVIYDKATAPPEKKRPRELVEIDEDGEKIVLDSSQESCDKSMERSIPGNKIETSYKTCDSKTTSTDYKSVDTSKELAKNDPEVSGRFETGHSMTNGSADTKQSDSDQTTSPSSDLLAELQGKKDETLSPTKKPRLAPEVLISISDSEGDSFLADDRVKNKLEPASRENSTIKIVEKEVSVVVKLKCLVHIDESTKEHVERVITAVHCESSSQDFSSTHRRNSDTSACLADISGNAGDNRDASPGSVTSNAQPYPLNPRLSLVSMVSSSSASSAGSLNAKLASKGPFQLPRLPVKHVKKVTSEISTPDGKHESNESFELHSKEWKNVGLLVTSFLNCAKEELVASELHNGSAERVLPNDSSLERIRSSTPEVEPKDKPVPQAVTPKNSSKRNRPTKRSRSKTVQAAGSNGLSKTSPVAEAEPETAPATPSSSRKRKSSPETPSRQSTNSKDSLSDTTDELVGKEVFAKWSDNKYYPGTVVGKTKTKFRVNFYDGQHKLIIEDFIVPMPTTLQVGLSVYATSSNDDYGSCGIIINSKKVKDSVIYTVQTDEQEELRVQIKNIFLTNDQVQVLKEETKEELLSPPSTPKHLGKVTLDNVVEGTRRSKRITTPVVLTPKAKRMRGSLVEKSVDTSKPSASGVSSKLKPEENYDTTSDSNYSAMEDTDLLGVQPELVGTPNEQETKGPASRIKGKARSRKRSEDPDIVAKLGPIPPANSNIFNGMSFLLTCASLDIIDRFQADTKDSNSDPGTENEEEWTRKPFVRERLVAQLNAGGGKLYESFELIPPEEYENTKLITNVPNLTKKSLLCLSVGIKAYNHQWIIRCCKENKIVNPSEEELPAGWSLIKQSYVEMFERRNKKPFQTLPVIVVIPLIPGEKDFVTFWTHICQNAGGAVLLPENPDDSFIEGTVVLTNKRCPSWIIEKAKSWSIPLVSTTWAIQSLIEGNICTYDAHPSFDYNYVKRPSSHISSSKRLQ